MIVLGGSIDEVKEELCNLKALWAWWDKHLGTEDERWKRRGCIALMVFWGKEIPICFSCCLPRSWWLECINRRKDRKVEGGKERCVRRLVLLVEGL